ncbi:DUF1206 domain-containing protein [Salinimonas sediminis]|uniref:DUF1206 domain-containing protein n=1 Tax=Salinimonas sediminis TaxID=2303538 RepID=A0A346NHC0_9ALTE|nr:DUF1206 domain-containing protein [Salinimonas sediminis]AXR04927.1 DUF1206 domain-containing protein [Salinimonas sediminis]
MPDHLRAALAFGGYAAKTVVYCLLGLLIIGTAIGTFQAKTPSQKSVFVSIVQQPFGQILLGAVIIGMACYVLWRLTQAFFNADNLDSHSAKDIVMRIFYFVSAVIYGFGTYLAIKVFQGVRSSGSGSNSQQMSSNLMQETWGVWVVGICGALIIAFSFIQFKHAIKADFMDKFDRYAMSYRVDVIARLVGRCGFFARGIVYVLVGSFFTHAALTIDPQQAGGLQEALQTIMQQTYGQYGLAVVGAGFFTFGLFCALESWYHRT